MRKITAMGRGFTLIEALIAAGVSLTALVAVGAVLVLALRGSARGIARAELQQYAAASSRWLLDDLQASAPGAIALPDGGPGPQAVSIHPLAGVTPDGVQIWADHLVVYSWSAASETLLRKVWPPLPPGLGVVPSPEAPLLLTSAQARAIANQANGTERVLARELTAFELAGRGGGVTLPLRLRMVFSAPVAGRQEPETVHYECSINLWNRVL